MNTLDVMRHGHQTVLRAVDGLEPAYWEAPEVVGVWSAKHVIAHLSSFEAMLVDVLTVSRDEDASTPVLDEFRAGPARFNDAQVAVRGHLAPDALLSEYEAYFDTALALARTLPDEIRTRTGALPWYGSEYDVEDFIVYTFYGHKREHAAQIKLFRARLERG
jgi:hypothetical protein